MREFSFDSDGVQLFGVEDGEGAAIVMLHGGMADHRAVLPLIAPLRDNYRVVAPDLRGSGRSWNSSALTFDVLVRDAEALLDHLDVEQVVLVGVSSGTGTAMKFALEHPGRLRGLVIVTPVYAGEDRGYTDQQTATFAMMDGLASRAIEEGVGVLRPLYANLPAAIREKAMAMLEEFDPASVVATSRFIASGDQPFASVNMLKSIEVPSLLLRGDDPMHPAEVSDLYAAALPNCYVYPPSTHDVGGAISAFLDETGLSSVPSTR